MNEKPTHAVRKVVTLAERSIQAEICPRPISSSPGSSIVIKTTEPKPFPARLEPSRPTARTLAESPDFAPDWRAVLVEQYIEEMNSQPEGETDPAKQLEQILEREPDQTVCEALQFHLGALPQSQKRPLEYALRCLRVPEIQMAIKAMIMANVKVELIAKEVGTHPSHIRTFELLYFDARPYLENRPWLRRVCFGPKGHRWLQVAFDRGWAGVQEVVLQPPQNGERDLPSIASVQFGRVKALLLEKEASNIAPTDKEFFMLLAIAGSYGRGKFYLSEEEDLSNQATQSCADPGTGARPSLRQITEELAKRSHKELYGLAERLLQQKIAEEQKKPPGAEQKSEPPP